MVGKELITSVMDRHWVAIRCEATRVSEATPAIAEASKATCIYLSVQTFGL